MFGDHDWLGRFSILRKMFDFQLFVNVVCISFAKVLSQTVWTSDSTPGAKRRKQRFGRADFLSDDCVCLWNKLESSGLGRFESKHFGRLIENAWCCLMTLIWFLKFLLLNHIYLLFFFCWLFSLFSSFYYEVFPPPVLKIVAVQADWSVISRSRLTWSCCESCLIFSSLWTLFACSCAGFESDHLDVWFKTWCERAKTTFSEELIFELLTFFVCGTSWSEHKKSGVLNQNIFDVWLKTPVFDVHTDIVPQMRCFRIDFALVLFFFDGFVFFFSLFSFEFFWVILDSDLLGWVYLTHLRFTHMTKCFMRKMFDFQLFVNVVFGLFSTSGFESDRLDVWFNTWCKEVETAFSEELSF